MPRSKLKSFPYSTAAVTSYRHHCSRMADSLHARNKESLKLSLHMPEFVPVYKADDTFSSLLQGTGLIFKDTSRTL